MTPIIFKFPPNCTLLEWSEQQQTFFVNEVRDGVPDKQVNIHNVFIVYVCSHFREAILIADYVEKYIIRVRGNKPDNFLTLKEMNRRIKALTTFSNKHSKIINSNKIW